MGRRGYRLSQLVIVNPYPVAEFFQEITRLLKPERCVLLVDDGWPPLRVDHITEVLRKAKVLSSVYRVQASTAGGLVHAKMYFFRWRSISGNNRVTKLFWGSPNASAQGFGTHAEVLSELQFSAMSQEDRKSANAYFDALAGGNLFTSGITLTPSAGVRLWLPSIELAADGTPTLDSWIRSGRLCHRYEPDTSFGKLTVKLRKPLEKTNDEQIFEDYGFARETRREVLQRSYAGAIGTADENPRWRGRFFVETDYGHWTSNDCFIAQEQGELYVRGRPVIFQAQGAQNRKDVLDSILDADDAQHQEWIDSFASALEDVRSELKRLGTKPDDYLYMKAGRLVVAKYAKQWKEKLRADYSRARIPEFSRRIETGYVFPVVPPLGPEYEGLVWSLFGSLLRGARLLRRPNALARAIGDVLGAERIGELEDARDLYEALREAWTEPDLRQYIRDFYIDRSDYDDQDSA
jgi:hypothetical protein